MHSVLRDSYGGLSARLHGRFAAILRRLVRLQDETKRAALTLAFRLDPDPAPVHLDDAPGQGQADPGPLDVQIQPIEQAEDVLMIAGVDADAVVAHPAQHLAALPPGADLDARCGLLAHEVDGVVEQVLIWPVQEDRARGFGVLEPANTVRGRTTGSPCGPEGW